MWEFLWNPKEIANRCYKFEKYQQQQNDLYAWLRMHARFINL